MQASSPRLSRSLFALLLVLASALPYLNSISGHWLMDDVPLIARNPRIHNPAHWPSLLSTDYWAVRGAPSGVYRPLPMLSFGLNYSLGGGRPFSFHLVNLLLNAAVSLLLWRVLMLGKVSLAATCVLGWFALHPVHVEAVANIVGRSELLVAFFFLGAWAVHRRNIAAGSFGLRIAEFACWLGVSLSKENGVPLLLLPLVAWWVAPNRTSRDLFPRFAPAFVAGALYVLLRLVLNIGAPGLPRHCTWVDRIELVASATAKNLQLLSGFFTHQAVYPLPLQFAPTLVFAGTILFAALLLLPVLLITRRSPLAVPASALLLSMITLLQIYPNSVWVWERGLYVPTLTLVWLFAEMPSSYRLGGTPAGNLGRMVFAVVVLTFFTYRTTQFSRLYSDERLFWTHEHERSPHHLPTVISYSEILMKSKLGEETLDGFRLRNHAVHLHPDSGFAYSALVAAALQIGETEHAQAALTTASQRQLQFLSPAQQRQGYRSLAALARQAQLPSLAEQFLDKARRTNSTPLNAVAPVQ